MGGQNQEEKGSSRWVINIVLIIVLILFFFLWAPVFWLLISFYETFASFAILIIFPLIFGCIFLLILKRIENSPNLNMLGGLIPPLGSAYSLVNLFALSIIGEELNRLAKEGLSITGMPMVFPVIKIPAEPALIYGTFLLCYNIPFFIYFFRSEDRNRKYYVLYPIFILIYAGLFVLMESYATGLLSQLLSA